MDHTPCSFIWYELITPDLDGAKVFYDAVVGWRIDGPGEQPGDSFYRMIMRGADAVNPGATGGVLHLSAEMSAAGARPAWVAYLHADDVDAKAAEIVADGGAQLMAVQDIPQGRFALVTDPQGVPFYVMTPIPSEDAPNAASTVYDRDTPQHVAWNELATTDLPAAKDFYARHFGFVFEGAMPMGEWGDYCFFTQNGMGIGAAMPVLPHAPMPRWTFYFRVDDIDCAAAAVTAGGGQVIQGPEEVPGGDWSLNAIDPQGAFFALVGHKGA